MEYKSSSTLDTKKIAYQFAKNLEAGDVVFLNGDLGFGKTIFVQGVAEYFKYTDPVRSPTYTFVNVYKISEKQIKQIVHIDLYRINKSSELTQLALEEYLNDESSVVFIEWPMKEVGDMIKQKYTSIKFEFLNNEERKIIIN